MLFFSVLVFCNCREAGRESPAGVHGNKGSVQDAPEAEVQREFLPAEVSGAGPYREAARRAVSLMDDRTLAAQVLMTGVDGKGRMDQGMKDLLRAIPAGAVMLFRYNLDTGPEEIRGFIEECKDEVLAGGMSEARIAPYIAVDHEGGSVHRFGDTLSRLPPPLSYWKSMPEKSADSVLALIEEHAFSAGTELRGLGITMNLAPVAEFLSEGNGSFLDDRSYGPDPVFAGRAASSFVRGMKRAGVSCAVKHFPGHTGTDPHESSASLDLDPGALEELLVPFRVVLTESGVPAFMVSHVVVPAWDEYRSASLSPSIIAGRLRKGLSFDGIVLADDFSMKAVSDTGLSPEEAAVEAISAGVDMVMTWPMYLRQVHGSILEALQNGKLSRGRLREAAETIIYEKLRAGIFSPENADEEYDEIL